MDQLINLLVTVTLIEMMVAIGLGVTTPDLIGVAKNGGLLARAALANYVCVPAVTLALLRFVDPHPMVAVGFLILAVCPGAPYGPPFTSIAKGNVPVAVGLMVLLAGSSAFIAPLLLGWLLHFLSAHEPLKINMVKVAGTLLLTQLLPLCVGILVRGRSPALADKLQKPANVASKVLNATTLVVILAVQFRLLGEIRLRGFVGMAALLVASGLAGWLLSGASTESRRTLAVTTSLRNVSVGLVIASSDFPGTPAVSAAVAYGLVSLLGTLLFASWLGFRSDRLAAAALHKK